MPYFMFPIPLVENISQMNYSYMIKQILWKPPLFAFHFSIHPLPSRLQFDRPQDLAWNISLTAQANGSQGRHKREDECLEGNVQENNLQMN